MQSQLKFLLSLFSHSLGLSMGVCVRASPHWDVKMSVHCQAVSPSKQGPCGIRVHPIHLRTINSFLRALNRSSIKEAPGDLLVESIDDHCRGNMTNIWKVWTNQAKNPAMCLSLFLWDFFCFLAVQDSSIGDLVTVVDTFDFSDN